MNKATKELCIKMCALLQTPRDFVVGDFVTWKHPMLSNATFPRVGDEAIVTEIFCQVRDSASDSGSPYFYSNLDTRIGIFSSEGEFLEYTTDSRRLKKSY